MPPTYYYQCICNDRKFTSQRSLSLHENSCSIVAERDRFRYAPYMRRPSTRAEKSVEQSPVSVLGPNQESINKNLEVAPLSQVGPGVLAPISNPAAAQSSNPMVPPLEIRYPTTRACARYLLQTYREDFDALPEAPAPLPPDSGSTPMGPEPPRHVPRKYIRFVQYETPIDSFGRYRIYSSKPLTIPDSSCELLDFTDYNHNLEDCDTSPASTSLRDAIAPCPNLSVFYFLYWFWKGSNKSIASWEELRTDVILRPEFNPHDLAGVNLQAIDEKLALAANVQPGEEAGVFAKSEGWVNKSVSIQVPMFKKRATKGQYVSVPGLYSRKILNGVRKGFSQNKISQFHYEPFQARWVPPGATKSESQTIMDEIYTSRAMLEAHKEVQRLNISDEKCTLPRVVAAIMLGSDALQLDAFSTKKAWVLYMWLGNLSKYERCKPNSKSCFELAHIPSLPDSVKDTITKLNGRPPSSALLAHLRRELMHAVLNELLDAEFLQAWQHGIIIKCADGIARRVFPRIFTYSADYPERVLLSTIRDKGFCPCPRCLIPTHLIHQMGTRSDMQMRAQKTRHDSLRRQKLIQKARSAIYDSHKAVGHTEVEDLLKPMSLVPTENAFSRRLLPLKFDFFKMFVVDLLHEVELGVWKSLLIHIIRIIHGCGSNTVAEFNRRFRQVPTFCNTTIRKFSEDVASLKRLAARDFEDILQCCIPVFKGLLPKEVDSMVQRLLFTFAYWHALAKLRQHTSSTLDKLSKMTTKLGNELREFKSATDNMQVLETPRESAARQTRVAKRSQNRPPATGAQGQTGAKVCKLNLNTPKFHALGDYVATIAEYGTTDSFSTQTTELQHRKIKAQWFRTNMREAIPQMARIGDIGDALGTIKDRLSKLGDCNSLSNKSNSLSTADSSAPYSIGQSDRAEDSVNIPLWAHSHTHEPAVKFFESSLKRHLLSRIPGLGESQSLEPWKISFQNDRMYSHATLRINYTSYDVRRQEDIINPRSPCRFVLLRSDTTEDPTAHPFVYARVLGIYHAKVRFCSRPAKRMDFLWVRWLDYDETEPGGWGVDRLDRVFYGKCRNDAELLDAFGFVDPKNIVRACHLIPDFESGLVAKPASLVCDTEEGDWQFHYVNRFVDRDMVMRYIGGGIGHFNQCAPIDANGDTTTYTIEDDETEDIELDRDEQSPHETDTRNGGQNIFDNINEPENMAEYLEDQLLGAGDSWEGESNDSEADDCIEDLYDM